MTPYENALEKITETVETKRRILDLRGLNLYDSDFIKLLKEN